ncbi:MAG: sigma-54-dependent Fis family transcriptional regulator [Candidatus Zixiibacteriota bacterium]|nr:MAG: sigma-54-dependent Fis family transcriptional regulator [candidate division Zixibacteria bacterium]
MKINILTVDDEKIANDFFVETLSRAGYIVEPAYSAEEALEKLKDRPFDIVVSDIRMKGMDGIELLEEARKLQPDVVFIVVTAYGTVEIAVRAMKLGAYDFLLKPVSPDALEIVVERARELIVLKNENRRLRSDLAERYQDIVGKSPKMKEVFELIQTTANARSTVLITGESGTGKELVARAIHHISERQDKLFVTLNCAALPENLVEAELFGYEKGAFTGAVRQHKGRFEAADGGTLLLDEISEMPKGLQAKLLRVLQEKQFERIGSTVSIDVDVRVIATSNRNLKEAIQQGRFRDDLFYRLNVIPITIVPLRERTEDIPLLTSHFVEKYNKENGKSISGVDESVLRLFMKYHWPGNVRELENYIERAVVTSTSNVLTRPDFPQELSLGKLADEISGLAVGMTLSDGEKFLILKTLEKCDGNKTRAAEVLNITPRTIRNKLAEYNLEQDEP